MEPQTEVDLSAFGLSPVHERDPTGAPLLSEVEGETLVSSYPDVNLVLGQDLNQGPGYFYVTSRWVCQGGFRSGGCFNPRSAKGVKVLFR